MTVAVAVAVARADDAGPQWRRRHAWRRGGYVGDAGRGGAGAAAGAPAAGGRGGDGRGIQGRAPRGGHHAAAAPGGAARGGGRRRGGGAGDRGRGGAGMPPGPGAGRGVADGDGDNANPARVNPLELRKDSIDWLDGNPNTQDESSSNIQIPHSDSENEDVQLPQIHKLEVDSSHPEPEFLEFDEPNVFENPDPQQSPEVNKMNDELLMIFESLVLVRGSVHGLMCRLPVANDRESLGKEIAGEVKKADQLLKDATDKSQAIQAKGGIPVPIPPHFYTRVKPVRVRQ